MKKSTIERIKEKAYMTHHEFAMKLYKGDIKLRLRTWQSEITDYLNCCVKSGDSEMRNILKSGEQKKFVVRLMINLAFSEFGSFNSKYAQDWLPEPYWMHKMSNIQLARSKRATAFINSHHQTSE